MIRKKSRLPPRTPEPGDVGNIDWMPEEESNTKCKHGVQDCATCGTSSKRDALHTTRGGRGVLGRAIARSRKR